LSSFSEGLKGGVNQAVTFKPVSVALPVLPVVSRSLIVGRWSVPAWWRVAVYPALAGVTVTTLAFVLTLPDWLGFVGFCFVFFSAVVVGVHLRRNTNACTRVFADRVELDNGKGDIRVLRWNDVVVQSNNRCVDVWLENRSSGDTSYEEIRMERLEQGKAVRYCLPGDLHPLSPLGPTFVNLTALRQAFVLSLQLARPELRLSSALWELGELHPATLVQDARPKRFHMLGFGAIALLTAPFVATRDFGGRPLWSLGEIFGVWIFLAIVLGLAHSRRFVRADDPDVVAHRTALLDALKRGAFSAGGQAQGAKAPPGESGR
jgi:hypothetical protein